MHDAILANKTWMQSMQDTLQGPLLGESSIATQAANQEWLWAGYVDSVQRVINTGSGQVSWMHAAGNRLSPTLWPVIPEFELRVMKPLQASHGNGFYERFFSRSDAGMVQGDGTPKYPLVQGALDRYRAYELTYGHASFFVSNGPYNGAPGNMLRYADMVQEHYMLKALQEHYLSSRVSSIRYVDSHGALSTFEEILFRTETTDAFQDAQLRIEYEDGLVAYINHASTNWTVDVNGTVYSIPEDGFVARHPASGLLAFSAIAPGNAARIDYCLAPGEYEFFNGRGSVDGYGSLHTGGVRRVVALNFVHNRLVVEDAAGQISTIDGGAPSTVSLGVAGPASLAAGARGSVKAVASYSNGAHRTVTTLVDWSSSNPTVATVDEGGAVRALSAGQTTITTSRFETVAPTPLTLAVY